MSKLVNLDVVLIIITDVQGGVSNETKVSVNYKIFLMEGYRLESILDVSNFKVLTPSRTTRA